MKYIIATPLFILFAVQSLFAQSKELETFFETTNIFFEKHIHNGAIGFENTKIDESLSHLTEQIKRIDINEADTITQVAFLINAYNLSVLFEIKKLLPLNDIIYYNDFFHKKVIKIAGEQFTFDQLRNERLAFIASNPLFHFALIQAGLNFPILRNYAFMPDLLDEQLEVQTKRVINHPDFLKKEGSTIILPQFLKWYKKDLTGRKNSILRFINHYYQFENITLENINRIEYDKVKHWTLNYYLQSAKIYTTATISKNQYKLQFNPYNPSELIKPGSIEIQSLNNT